MPVIRDRVPTLSKDDVQLVISTGVQAINGCAYYHVEIPEVFWLLKIEMVVNSALFLQPVVLNRKRE
jgi:hypothetical protein